MADVITRFKLETTQYDSKLRDASKGLAEYTRRATQAGNEFGKFTQANVEAARALGTITPSANNAKDKVKELVTAFNDAAKAYNALTKEQQQSDFGKAMAQSIGQLSQKIREAKSELYDLDKAAKDVHSGGGLFGENGLTGILQVAGGNLLAQGVAALGSELTGTINQSIDLARQAEGIHIAFDRLNRPGLLANLKEATHGTVSELELMKAAVKFDDFKLPVEQLGTLLAFAQKKAKDTGQSVDYMVDSIVTGLGRKSLMILDNLGLSASQVKERMAETGDMTKAVADIIREEMAKAGDYVETAADRAARATAQATDKMVEMGRAATPIAEEVLGMWNTIKSGGISLLNTVLTPIANSLREINNLLSNESGKDLFEKWLSNTPGMEVGPNVDDNGNYIRKPSHGTRGWNWDTGHYDDEVSSIPEIIVSGKAPKRKVSGGRSASKALSIGFTPAQVSPEEMIAPPSVWKEYADGIKGTFDTIGDSMNNLTEWTQDFDPYKQKMDELTQSAKQQKMAFGLAASAAQGFGAALSGIEDPAAKAAGTVVSAIASIALGFAMASSTANTAGTGWGWLAWLGAGMSAMATTISTIHSLTGYQNGGVVKGYSSGGTIQGNSYSGDNIGGMVDGSQLIGLNAGEVVLNKAQQATLAQNLQGGGNIRMTGEIRGESIVLVANRYFKRTGQGEIVTW